MCRSCTVIASATAAAGGNPLRASALLFGEKTTAAQRLSGDNFLGDENFDFDFLVGAAAGGAAAGAGGGGGDGWAPALAPGKRAPAFEGPAVEIQRAGGARKPQATAAASAPPAVPAAAAAARTTLEELSDALTVLYPQAALTNAAATGPEAHLLRALASLLAAVPELGRSEATAARARARDIGMHEDRQRQQELRRRPAAAPLPAAASPASVAPTPAAAAPLELLFSEATVAVEDARPGLETPRFSPRLRPAARARRSEAGAEAGGQSGSCGEAAAALLAKNALAPPAAARRELLRQVLAAPVCEAPQSRPARASPPTALPLLQRPAAARAPAQAPPAAPTPLAAPRLRPAAAGAELRLLQLPLALSAPKQAELAARLAAKLSARRVRTTGCGAGGSLPLGQLYVLASGEATEAAVRIEDGLLKVGQGVGKAAGAPPPSTPAAGSTAGPATGSAGALDAVTPSAASFGRKRCGTAETFATFARELSRQQLLGRLREECEPKRALKDFDVLFLAFLHAQGSRLTAEHLRQLLFLMHATPKQQIFAWLTGTPLPAAVAGAAAAPAPQALLAFLDADHPCLTRASPLAPPLALSPSGSALATSRRGRRSRDIFRRPRACSAS